jgi:hypothetical protein
MLTKACCTSRALAEDMVCHTMKARLAVLKRPRNTLCLAVKAGAPGTSSRTACSGVGAGAGAGAAGQAKPGRLSV